MSRRALLIGINDYPDKNKLTSCVNDVKAMRSVLERHGNGSENFQIEEMLNEHSSRTAMGQIETLFSTDLDIALLYFSGHGYVNSTGSELVFPNDCNHDGYYKGLQMRSIMDIVNHSQAKNKIIILDCCHAGDIGRYSIDIDNSDLRPGVSLLSACRGEETAVGLSNISIFTAVLCMALQGAASDYTGNITMGSLYAYVDKFFSASEQRPVFKTNTTEFVPIRTVMPRISTDVVREIANLFPVADKPYPLDPSFEQTNSEQNIQKPIEPYADPNHVEVMKKLQQLSSVGFVEPIDEDHMYYAAMHSKGCRLTEQGKYYWMLVKKGQI